MGSERYIHSRGKLSSHVEAIGTGSLELSSGYVLQLEKTFYVPSFSRNLISVSALIPLGISCNFLGFWFFFINKIISYWKRYLVRWSLYCATAKQLILIKYNCWH